MLKEGEDLNNPAVLLRVADETEHLLADSLSASGYRLVDSLAPLKEGEACFVNGHLEVFFRKAVYPHNVFVRWSDGACGCVVWPGKSGRGGTTLPDAQQYLTGVLGVTDAVLLDNGGDVRLTYRGCELVRSSEKRRRSARYFRCWPTPLRVWPVLCKSSERLVPAISRPGAGARRSGGATISSSDPEGENAGRSRSRPLCRHPLEEMKLLLESFALSEGHA